MKILATRYVTIGNCHGSVFHFALDAASVAPLNAIHFRKRTFLPVFRPQRTSLDIIIMSLIYLIVQYTIVYISSTWLKNSHVLLSFNSDSLVLQGVSRNWVRLYVCISNLVRDRKELLRGTLNGMIMSILLRLHFSHDMQMHFPL